MLYVTVAIINVAALAAFAYLVSIGHPVWGLCALVLGGVTARERSK